jgi:D-threo-aldose 1-dehydrogenase
MRSLEESLERLQVDYVDMVLVHDPDEHEAAALEGAFPALDKLRGEGVIRSYGAGMNQSAMLARFVQKTDLDVVMLAGRFSLLEQPALEDLLPVAYSRGISVVAAGVFNSGILAREYPPEGAHYNYGVASAKILDRARELARACVEHGYTLPQVAAQFPFSHPAVSAVCLGARNADQARKNAALFDETVAGEFYQDLMEQGLLSEGSVSY